MQKLSSGLTWFYKKGVRIFFAILFLTGVVGFIIMLLWRHPNNTILELLGFWTVWFVFLGGMYTISGLFGASLKEVSLQGDTLVISDYRRTVEVSLRDVERVKGSHPIASDRITLYFRHPTEFGSRVDFFPRLRWPLSWKEHPLVRELEERIEQASG